MKSGRAAALVLHEVAPAAGAATAMAGASASGGLVHS